MPKIIGDSLAEHRAHTRRRLFDALAAMLDEMPLESISMAKLATRAGVGRTAVYNHFEDKESVVVAFASEETSRYLDSLQDALGPVTGPTDRLRTYIRHQLAHGDTFHLYLGARLAGSLSPAALQELQPHIRVVQQVLTAIIEDGVSAGEFAPIETRSAVMLVHACLHAGRVPAPHIEDFVVRALSSF